MRIALKLLKHKKGNLQQLDNQSILIYFEILECKLLEIG